MLLKPVQQFAEISAKPHHLPQIMRVEPSTGRAYHHLFIRSMFYTTGSEIKCEINIKIQFLYFRMVFLSVKSIQL